MISSKISSTTFLWKALFSPFFQPITDAYSYQSHLNPRSMAAFSQSPAAQLALSIDARHRQPAGPRTSGSPYLGDHNPAPTSRSRHAIARRRLSDRFAATPGRHFTCAYSITFDS